MKIGLHEWATVKKADFLTNLKLAAQYGYECIELLLENTDEYLKYHTIKEMRQALEKAGIRPSALSGLIHFNLLKNEDEKQEKLREFKRLCKICQGVGCDVVVLVPSPHHGESTDTIAQDAVAMLHRYADIARGYEVKIAVEFLGFKWASICDFGQCSDIVTATGRDGIGIALDCFHFYANGSRLDQLKASDPAKILALHIDDCTGRPVGEYTDDSLRVLPLDGEIPLVDMFKLFLALGITATPCIELFNEKIWNWEPEYAIRVFKDRIIKVLKESGY